MKLFINTLVILSPLLSYIFFEDILSESIFYGLSIIVGCFICYLIYLNIRNKGVFKARQYNNISFLKIRVANILTFWAGVLFFPFILYYFTGDKIIFYSYLILLDLFFITTIKISKL